MHRHFYLHENFSDDENVKIEVNLSQATTQRTRDRNNVNISGSEGNAFHSMPDNGSYSPTVSFYLFNNEVSTFFLM